MLSLIVTLPKALHAPDVREALSGIFGSVSLTAWICLLLPQLITNYKAKSADALSMKFLLIWLTGDVANLSGALFTSLAPSIIALAIYFCVADLILIAQCTYYNTVNARRRRARSEHQRHHYHHHHRRRSSATADDINASTAVLDPASPTEQAPLLDNEEHQHHRHHYHHHRPRGDSDGLPGSHRRHEVRRRESGLDPLTRIITGEDDMPDSNPWLHNTVSLVAVWVVGAAGWFVSYKMGAWEVADGGEAAPVPVPGDGGGGLASARPVAVVGMVLGYFSALCYLCARIPQIIKNYRDKSCEGLALLFFLLSLTGNLTYGASVIAYSQETDYLVRALPWLLGSLGTMVEDCIIFVQFRIYSPGRRVKAVGTV
ncbi:hypothetical protein VTK56DRAFT_3497 [Thermocarpiscus australiensis]